MSKTTLDTAGKPIAPRKDWPLTANGNGQWSKKAGGKVYYFGAWEDWRQAERNFARRWSSILAGLPDPGNEGTAPPAAKGEGCTFDTICNLYLAARKLDRERGDISPAHFADMRRKLTWLLDDCKLRLDATSSIRPSDWKAIRLKMEDAWGPDNRKTATTLIRSVSKWGAKNGHCPAWNFGDEFDMPARDEIRADRREKAREHGEKLFPREQVTVILESLKGLNTRHQFQPFRAMFLLAINAGFTAADLGELTIDALDLGDGFFDYDRVKTGVQRAGYLWPETVTALREAIAERPDVDAAKLEAVRKEWKATEPTGEGKNAIRRWQLREPKWDRLVFLTPFGQPWVRNEATIDQKGKDNASRIDSIGYEFRRILARLDKKHPAGVGGMKFKRPRVSFGTGRHTFYSAARRIDGDAAQFIQGHTDERMGAWYDHLDDGKLERLKLVSDALCDYFLNHASEGTALRRPLRLGVAGKTAVAS